jgi:uncharacterized protein YkwD
VPSPIAIRLALLTAVIVAQFAVCGPALPTLALQSADARCLSADEALLLDRINTYRRLEGAPALVASPTLSTAARTHAGSMATWNYFPEDYSVRPDGDPDNAITWQENIANAGYPDNTHTSRGAIIGAGTDSIAAIYRGLVERPVFRELLLDGRFRAIGIGFATNPESTEGAYWAITLGSLIDDAIAPCEGVAIEIPIVGSARTENSSESNVVYDGDLTTAWRTTTDDPPGAAYVWLDLGQVYELTAIEWFFSQAGGADQLAIDISTDRETWTQITRKGNGAVNQWRRLEWRGEARYIRFFFANPNEDDVLGYLAEVRVYR